jgi:hypothetical protein
MIKPLHIRLFEKWSAHMDQNKYVDFKLEIDPATSGTYPVRIESAAGSDRASMILPTANEIYTSFMTSLSYNMPTDRAQERDFGKVLYEALIQGKIREAFRAARDDAQRNEQTLRIKLSIDPDLAELVEVAAVPWEFAISDVGVPLSTEYSFCRFLARAEALPKLTVTDAKLKVLLAWALPTELAAQYPVNVEAEVAAIQAALKPLEAAGKLTIIVEPHLTGRKLQRRIETDQPHIIHFVGHGVFEGGIGALVLEKNDGSRQDMPVDVLVDNVRSSSVRLVVLNACLTGTVSLNLLRGIAPALLAANIPAVVAMQSTLNDEAGVVFAEDFYTNLAENKPIDLCVSRGRRAIRNSTGTRDWGLATLYMRAPDGILFAGLGAAEQPTAAVQPASDQPAASPPTPESPSSSSNITLGSGNNMQGATINFGSVAGRDIVTHNTTSPSPPTPSTSASGSAAQIDVLRRKRTIVQNNLNELELTEAKFGSLYVPVYVKTQIEEARNEINQIDAQIKQLGG